MPIVAQRGRHQQLGNEGAVVAYNCYTCLLYRYQFLARPQKHKAALIKKLLKVVNVQLLWHGRRCGALLVAVAGRTNCCEEARPTTRRVCSAVQRPNERTVEEL